MQKQCFVKVVLDIHGGAAFFETRLRRRITKRMRHVYQKIVFLAFLFDCNILPDSGRYVSQKKMFSRIFAGMALPLKDKTGSRFVIDFDQLKFDSGLVRLQDGVTPVVVDIEDADRITLVTEAADFSLAHDYAFWGAPRLVKRQ